MASVMKKIALGVGGVVVVAGLGAGGYVYDKTSAYDRSLDEVYQVPIPSVERSQDPAIIARGKHLIESLGACSTKDCHGADLGGGRLLDLGPIGTVAGPNITSGGLGAAYTDGELVRLLKHGIKKDGRGIRMMPVQDFSWLPDKDRIAMVSYLRTVPPVSRPNGAMVVKPLAKILDRRNELAWDVARRLKQIDGAVAPDPAPTAEYGAFVARLCTGCHGERLSGGKIPGTPPSIPIPLNITPHETGLKDWTFADFEKLLTTGVKKNGQTLHPFMPVDAVAKMDDIEKKALWNYLRSVPALPFGQR